MATPGSQGTISACLRDFSNSQLLLIRRTIARLCTDAEFDEFIAVARQSGLDPMRRQITPLIVHPEDPNRRRLIPWATIDGLRVIAARCGDYRPMESAALIEHDRDRIDADRNPLGIVRAEVRAWKYRDGEWFAVVGEAWWDEYAPLREVWESNELGGRGPTGRMLTEPSWARMGRVMIAKCAEAQALRRGWPDVLSGLYTEEELQAQQHADAVASERLKGRQAERDKRAQSGHPELWFVLDDMLQSVTLADAADRMRQFYAGASSPAAIEHFQAVNRQSLQLFWERAPSEALAMKMVAEQRLDVLSQEAIRRPARRTGRAKISQGRKGRHAVSNGRGGAGQGS